VYSTFENLCLDRLAPRPTLVQRHIPAVLFLFDEAPQLPHAPASVLKSQHPSIFTIQSHSWNTEYQNVYIYIYIYIYVYIYLYIYIYIYILAEKRAAFLAGAHAAGIADQKGKQENLEIASASLPRKELEVEEEKVVVKAGRFGGGREKAATMGGHSKVVGKGECSLEAPPPDGARTPVRGECFGWCA